MCKGYRVVQNVDSSCCCYVFECPTYFEDVFFGFVQIFFHEYDKKLLYYFLFKYLLNKML